jgi:hypothetical protein
VTATQIEQVLTQEPVPLGQLDELLSDLGPAAADPMLDALIRAESSQTRLLLIERLIRLGPEIGPAVRRRLADERWYVIRNMLALLGELPVLPAEFDAAPYAEHADGRVRREALRILLRDPAARDGAICLGLTDADDHVVRLALTAATRRCPDAAIPLLERRAESGSNPDQRVAAIRLLARIGHPGALEVFLRIATPRRSLFRVRPQPKSREYLAALRALNRFAHDPRARDALAVAARSRDPEIAGAAVEPLDDADD